MSISNRVPKKVAASAASKSTAGGVGGNSMARCLAFTFTLGFLGLVSPTRAAGTLTDAEQDLDNAVTDLTTRTGALSTDMQVLLDRYDLTNTGKCAMLILSISSGSQATLSFIPGPDPITVLQGDIANIPGAPITSIVPGPVATDAGKTIPTNQLSNAYRFLVIGFNQNTLKQGVLGNITFDTSTLAPGSYPIFLTNFLGSDPQGNSVPLCGTSGVLTK